VIATSNINVDIEALVTEINISGDERAVMLVPVTAAVASAVAPAPNIDIGRNQRPV
jgi:hypothetical protein